MSEILITVNENFELIDPLTNRIKALTSGIGEVTVTSGGFTKAFNININPLPDPEPPPEEPIP